MEMPRPGAAHEKLQLFVGQWSGEEVIAASPLDPAGGPANAKVDNRLLLDGFIVIRTTCRKGAARSTSRATPSSATTP